MAIKRVKADINVVEAANIRIQNVFDTGLPVYIGFSAGKDSLVLLHLIYAKAKKREIDPKKIHVYFIDEEAVFPCVEKIAKDWRQKILLLGGQFTWYCLEVKHFNCFNQLENDESFFCWDRYKEDVWVRRPPSFAVRSHPKLRPRIDTYQAFMPRVVYNSIQLTGVRAVESVQRLYYLSKFMTSGKKITEGNTVWPIYDWKDADVWKYLRDNRIDIPDTYLHMWRVGRPRNQLRISQLFSIDTARSLVNLGEIYPDLMERVIAREPGAQLAMLYWDSEMFGRKQGARRKAAKKEGKQKDYKKLTLDLLSDIPKNFESEAKREVAKRYKNSLMKISPWMNEKDWHKFYEGLIAGDPKTRTLRAVTVEAYNKRAIKLDEMQKGAKQ